MKDIYSPGDATTTTESVNYPNTAADQSIAKYGERPSRFSSDAQPIPAGFPQGDSLTGDFRTDVPPVDYSDAKNVAEVAASSVDKPLWEHLHPGGWSGDDPGHTGGLGCAASVSEALRLARVFSREEDETSASGLEKRLTAPPHNWSKAGQWQGNTEEVSRGGSGNSVDHPVAGEFPKETDVKPGDVIIGYRKGEGGADHAGDDAHSGIVGIDKNGKLVVYSNAGNGTGENEGKEVWTAMPFESFVKGEGFSDGIVVLRALK